MRSTNRHDKKGQEVFVGDKVLFYWGWFPWKGQPKGRMRLHTITEGKPFWSGDGTYHEHEPGVLFCMDACVNDWVGKCLKVTDEYIQQYNIPEGVDFFEDGGVAVPITGDVNVYGLSDEEFEKWKDDLNKKQAAILWQRGL